MSRGAERDPLRFLSSIRLERVIARDQTWNINKLRRFSGFACAWIGTHITSHCDLNLWSLRRVEPSRCANPIQILVEIDTHHLAPARANDRRHRLQLAIPD